MPAPEILNLPPEEAVRHFRAKGHHFGFDWRDTDAALHVRSFTAAKAMRLDILTDIRTAVDAAIADGNTLQQFRDRLEPLLRKKGWWGQQLMTDPKTGEQRLVQLGSARRLRTIFDTNLRASYARGRWERIERLKTFTPYLRYVAVLDSRTRPVHARWHGAVLPVDHPFWRTHYPPNGWGCRCIVQQLSQDDLKRYDYGLSKAPPTGWDQGRPWLNKRTGKVHQVPFGIDPGWNHNVGLVGEGFSLRDPNAIPELDEATALHRRLQRATGSNPGGLYLGSDGARRYVKFYNDPAQAYSEAVANRAYRELGLEAPQSSLVRMKDGKIAVANDIIDNQGTVGTQERDEEQVERDENDIIDNQGTVGTGRRLNKSRAQDILRGYTADVWLANWDAVGTNLDNVVATAARRYGAARIDQGGALIFRAQGARKPPSVSGRGNAAAAVTEWDGFASSSTNPAYARVIAAAGLSSADDLGRKALNQIAAVNKLRQRTRNFQDLVPETAGVPKTDREEILGMLRKRADALEKDIAPKVKAAMLRSRNLPEHQLEYQRELGPRYAQERTGVLNHLAKNQTPRRNTSDQELVSMWRYSGPAFGPLNRTLRSRGPDQTTPLDNFRLTLNDALDKLEDYRGTVKRRTTLPPNVLAQHQPGNIVEDPGFQSTSAEGESKFPGPHHLTIASRHGKRIQPYSRYPDEREVLFKSGTRFRVVDRVDKNRGGIVEIILQELNGE